MDAVVTTRKWGNSIGIALPKEMIEKEHIKPNETLIITLKKRRTIKEIFGTAKFKKTAQEMKDEDREAWGE